MTLPAVPREHIDLLLGLKRSIDTEAFEEMKLVVRADEFGGFQYAELEKIKNVREMLCELEVKGVVGVGEYGKLREIMRSIDKIFLIEYIDETEELLKRKVSNAEMTSHSVPELHQSQASCSGVTADGPLQAADKVEKSLRKRYKTTGSYVQIIPWVGDDMKPISDIYTKLKLQNTDCRGEQLKSYEDMFLVNMGNTKEQIQRIIVDGVAGVGKSTLMDKIAYDWANGEKLKKYKLVFVLKMFALEEFSEFIDAIFNQLVDKDVAVIKADLKLYITTNPEEVLFLFDGFDEFKTTNVSEISKSSGDVFRILNRNILRDSCSVVTTRPSHFSKLVSKPLIEKPFVHVEVLGFNGEDIEQYIHKFFSKDMKEHDYKAEGLNKKIESSDVLFDLAKSPMLLLLMCILWREQSTIPDTMFRLYKEAFRYIFKRKQLLQDEASQVVIAIGENALDNLLSPHQFLSFKEGDFEDQVLRSALKAGVLTSQRVIKGLDTRHSVSFIHRTFQEYCAAVFFQSLLGTDDELFNKNLDRVGNIMKKGLQGLEYLLRFCCGDNQSCTNKVLSLMRTVTDELPFMCYFEGQFEDLPSVDLVTEEISIQEYSNDGLRALFYFLKHLNADDEKKGRENAKLSKVTRLTFHSCYLESFLEVLGEVMSAMKNLSSFELNECEVAASSTGQIASLFVNTTKLQYISINNGPDLCRSFPSWGLQCLEHLERLKITSEGYNFPDKDVKNLAASLGVMKKLKHCRLSHMHEHGTKSPTCVLYDLWLYRERLDICNRSITSPDLKDILGAIKIKKSYMQDMLFMIILSENQRLGNRANLWAGSFTGLDCISFIFLKDCAMRSGDIEHLARSLKDMTRLRGLDLSENRALGDGDAVLWAPHLAQLNQLKKLYLCTCSLTGADMEPISQSFDSMMDTRLYLDFNDKLWLAVRLCAHSSRHFKHL